MECERCGIRGEDLPDNIDLGEFFERMYGEMYCAGCIIAYEEGIWVLYDAEIYDWEEEE